MTSFAAALPVGEVKPCATRSNWFDVICFGRPGKTTTEFCNFAERVTMQDK
jgi:hypothetical protein